jgi:hypothetical protein
LQEEKSEQKARMQARLATRHKKEAAMKQVPKSPLEIATQSAVRAARLASKHANGSYLSLDFMHVDKIMAGLDGVS